MDPNLAPRSDTLPESGIAGPIGEVSLSDVRAEHDEYAIEDLELAYADHAPAVAALRAELLAYASPAQHPAHMGSGTGHKGHGQHKHAYHLEGAASAKPLVAKLFKESDPGRRSEQVEGEAAVLLRVKDLQTFEHVVAASREQGVIISEDLEAPITEHVDDEALSNLSDEQIGEAVRDIGAATQRNVSLDRNPGNILLGNRGLRFLDPASRRSSLWVNLQTLALALASAGEHAAGVSREARTGALERLAASVKDVYPDEESVHRELEGITNGTREGHYDPEA